MKYPTRIYYTETDKAMMWDRWQKGESLNAIARHFGRSHSSIQGILARAGGIRPPPRRRSRRALTLSEREEICRGVVAGQSLRSIAVSLDRVHRTKTCKLAENRALARIVARRWLITNVSVWTPISKSTSVIHKAHGNVDRMKIPTVC